MDQAYSQVDSSNNQRTHQLALLVANAAIVLVLIVVLMGGWTRINDAGLSCPDWPGCFGQIGVPNTELEIKAANELYPKVLVEEGKGWLEMIHRYLAGSLGLLILCLAVISIPMRKSAAYPHLLSIGLLILVIFQAMLGMWTVTLKLLPIIVTAHLFGGLLTTVLLFLLKFKLQANYVLFKKWKRKNYILLGGLVLLFMQVLLGGWTSSNYAGWGCSDWLACNPSLDIKYNFYSAFNVTFDTTYSHQGGTLGIEQRGAIQILHRLGALAVFIYFLAAFVLVDRKENYWKVSLTALLLVVLQIVFGFANVIWSFPASLAMGHHLLALALLVASTLMLVKSFELST